MRLLHRHYQIGPWAFIMTGTGHLLAHWLTPRTADQESVLDIMRKFPVKLPGSDGNLYQYHTGFSLMMGILLIAYGAQALLTLSNRSDLAQRSVKVLVLHTLVSAVALLLSVKFFFVIPIVLMAIALTGFGLDLLFYHGAPTQVRDGASR